MISSDLLKTQSSISFYHFQISDKSIARLKASKIWKVENEFYEFAETQFKAIKTALLKNNKDSVPQKFHYDKIRPKS